MCRFFVRNAPRASPPAPRTFARVTPRRPPRFKPAPSPFGYTANLEVHRNTGVPQRYRCTAAKVQHCTRRVSDAPRRARKQMWPACAHKPSLRKRRTPTFRLFPREAGVYLSAVTVGFEPTVGGCPTRHFECRTFGRSDTSPSDDITRPKPFTQIELPNWRASPNPHCRSRGGVGGTP